MSNLPTLLLGVVIFFVVASLLHRSGSIAWKLDLIVRALVAYFGVALVSAYLFQVRPEMAITFGVIAALLVDRAQPNRSRAIPAATRRRVIERWEQETGKKFNSRAHEIDHIVPFSKGGDHSERNLQIVTKRRNRAKGAKSPWWDVLGK